MALNLSESSRVKLIAAFHTAWLSAEDLDNEGSLLAPSLSKSCDSSDSGRVPRRCCLETTLQRSACPSTTVMV